MTAWDAYPPTYRSAEIQSLLRAVCTGECAALLGLSGSGKSNLLGFLANRVYDPAEAPPRVLVDCNRLEEPSPGGFYRLLLGVLGQPESLPASLSGLETALDQRLAGDNDRLCLLFDRFDALSSVAAAAASGNLRDLRDRHKYALTFVIAARRPPDPQSELAELFFANTLWLGPLNGEDARWSVAQFTRRRRLDWDEADIRQLIQLSGGYPAWLRAACEAHAAGAALDACALHSHPAVRQRLAEFWADEPSPDSIAFSRLSGIPLLDQGPQPSDETQTLTAKEQLLLAYLVAHPGGVCEKDELIRAVWPEDRIFSKGIRDDSLAQLVRRLRAKVEPDPSAPRRILTVAGRGYRYKF